MKKNLWLPFTFGLVFILFSCKKEQHSWPEPQYGTMTDIEGNIYKTVKIGDQEWMVENLKTHKLNDGTPIDYVTADITWSDINSAEPMMCYYDNDVDKYKDKFGALYNSYAVQTGKLAPEGWHVPTDADWQKLQDYLIANGYNYDGSKSGNKIAKSLAAKTGWDIVQNVGSVGHDQLTNNRSGFNVIPVGYRDASGTFLDLGYLAFFKAALNPSNYWGLDANGVALNSNSITPHSGLSIRCIKD
ncbi:MAG: hypothetical protein RLZ47_1653 [Bacteroidota bacterium]|jgi:uncharacterized protein (TIGR02145 family)